jgi:hypothetical protein
MKPREFIAKRKKQIIVAAAFLLALVLNIAPGLIAGKPVAGAIWTGLREIPPMDYLMFAGFWYVLFIHRPKDDWSSNLTALNLSDSHSQK